MIGYVIHRILLAIPTLFVITFLSFAISRLAPGDPAELKVGMGQGQQFQSAGKGRDVTDEMVKQRINELAFYRVDFPFTPEERDRNAMNSKRESHAHRYYSHNW